MIFPLVGFLLALATAAIHCSAAVLSDFDRTNWHKATSIYKGAYKNGEFISYRTNLDTFSQIPNLEQKALSHAETIGVISVAKYEATASLSPTAYFSSVIKPGQELHKDMHLHENMDAFAFWKHEGDRFHLLHIDTLNHLDNEWPLKPLEEVLSHH